MEKEKLHIIPHDHAIDRSDRERLLAQKAQLIWFVGLSGSGKSTLLKIMAGEDNEFEGQAAPLKGSTVGFLPQEPILAGEQTVRENVEQAFGNIKKMINEFNEVSSKMAEPMSDDEMEKAMEFARSL